MNKEKESGTGEQDVLHAALGHIEGGYFTWVVYHGIEISSNHHQTIPEAVGELSALTEQLWGLRTVLADITFLGESV